MFTPTSSSLASTRPAPLRPEHPFTILAIGTKPGESLTPHVSEIVSAPIGEYNLVASPRQEALYTLKLIHRDTVADALQNYSRLGWSALDAVVVGEVKAPILKDLRAMMEQVTLAVESNPNLDLEAMLELIQLQSTQQGLTLTK